RGVDARARRLRARRAAAECRHCGGCASGHRGLARARPGDARARRARRLAASEARGLRPRAHADRVLAARRRGVSRADAGRAHARDRARARRPFDRAARRARSCWSPAMSVADSAARGSELACTAAAKAFQKAFGAELKKRVVENGEPFVVAQADTPHEIFHALGIPVVTNQWWAAYISAKRLSARYFGALDALGFPPNRCNYCSLGLACTLADDPATAPWGGLPQPTVLVARLTCDCIQQVFSAWAAALRTEFFPLEAPAWVETLPEWYRHSSTRWEDVYGAGRIELLSAEMRDLIALLERKTGRVFDMARLTALMGRINEQESLLAEAAVAA